MSVTEKSKSSMKTLLEDRKISNKELKQLPFRKSLTSGYMLYLLFEF